MKISKYIACLIFIISAAFAGASAASAADFSWTIGENQKLAEVGPSLQVGNIVDANCNTYWDGNQLWVFFTGDGVFNRYVGPDMDHLTKLEPSKLVGFDMPHGDDAYWANGIYVDDNGRWYTTLHVEYNYGDGEVHERYIMYATSDDNAATWTLRDVIISSDGPEKADEHPGRYETFGDGDNKIIVDEKSGYIYCYHMKKLVDRETAEQFQSLYVARSPISANMAAGSWEKWYKGEWCEPGIGGHESPLFTQPDTAVFVTWNTYLERYVAIGWQKPNNEGFISTCTSLEENDWTTPQQFCPPGKLGWYCSTIDPETNEATVMGQKFRLYCYSASTMEPYYFEVEFDKTKPTSAEEQPYFHSDYSLLKSISYLPEYNSMLQIVPDYAYYEMFDNGTDSWRAEGGAQIEIARQQRVLQIRNGITDEQQPETESDASSETETDSESKAEAAEQPESTPEPTADASPAAVYDTNAPSIGNGFLRFTVNLNKGNQLGIYLKYSGADDYYMVRYNNGKFTLENQDGVLKEIYDNYLKDEYAYGFRFDFFGDRLIFKIDENVVFDGRIEGFDGSKNAPFAFASCKGTEVSYDDIVCYDGIRVEIDGFEIAFDAKPLNDNGRVLVPMRKIFELFGAEVTYDEATKQVTAVKDNTEIILTSGSSTAYINGEPAELDTCPVTENDRTLIPIRFIMETLKADVDWNGDEQKVLINSNGNLFIKLPQLEPWQTEFADPREGLYVEDYFNSLNEYTNEGIFSLTQDNRPEFDVRARIYRRNEAENVSRIYNLITDITDIKVHCYGMSDEIEDYYILYTSPDGEEWTELKCKAVDVIEDPNRSGMFFFDIIPSREIPAGSRYLKIELIAKGEYWRNQLANVKINASASAVDTDMSDGLTDRFSTMTLIKERSGDFMTESDEREEFDCLNRLYRKNSTLASSLVYEVPFDVSEIRVKTYTNSTRPDGCFEISTSADGVSWTAEKITSDNVTTDPQNPKMNFADISCAVDTQRGVRYVKITCLPVGENWCNQLVNVNILPDLADEA